MPARRANTQLFALDGPPPPVVEVAGRRWRLARVFKHDFYAATCLYRAADAPPGRPAPRIVVKFARRRPFCGLPMAWAGRLLRDRERAVYRAIRGVPGVPRWLGTVGETGFAIEYIDARPLDHLPAPPAGYFDRLRAVLDALHARGVGYCDANKRSNLLVGDGGQAYLIDFQIAVRRRDDWPWPLSALARRLVAYVARKDLYHLCKHKRRLAPGELTAEEDAISRRRGGLHGLHRKLTKPYRLLRRRFLAAQFRKGRLVSPSAHLENHHQPEKRLWRTHQGAGDEGDGPG
jgi:hypothetical protein